MTEFLPGPNGYPTNGLRDDGRQWLIYGEPQQGALVRGVEAMALSMAGQSLVRVGRKSNLIAIRALGFFMVNLADARMRDALNAGDYRATVVGYLAKVTRFVAGQAPPPDPQILDELHALTYQTDHRARSAGIRGEGTLRQLIRGDT